MVTFIVVPLVAGFFALFFSKLDILIRGDRAREPIFKFAQPLEDKTTNESGKDEELEGEVAVEKYEEFEEYLFDGATESDNMKDKNDLSEDKKSDEVAAWW